MTHRAERLLQYVKDEFCDLRAADRFEFAWSIFRHVKPELDEIKRRAGDPEIEALLAAACAPRGGA